MKKLWLLICGVMLLTVAPPANAGQDVPVKETVTMADIGSTTCIPCKMMEPILKNLRTAYKGRAAVIFVDINKNRSAGRDFGLRAIPTQIFFDRHGHEKWRHLGFLDQKTAAAKLDELLAEK